MALSDLLQQAHFEMMSVNAPEHAAPYPACILFFSLCDGKQRAYTHISTGKTFNQAWTSGSQFIQRYRQQHDLQICWLRVERVDHIEEMSWAGLQDKLGKTKRNYFRFGLSFDPDFTHAILEQELAANAILYDGKVGVAIPNETNLNNYAQRRFSCSLSWPTDPQQRIWRFKTQAVFCDASGAKTIEREGKASGFRKIAEPWQAHLPNLINHSAQYLASQIKSTGEYHYGWFPCFDRKIKSYNALRHASSTYALIEGWQVTQQPQQRQAIERALAYLTDELIQYKTLAEGRQAAFLVDTGDEIKLGGNAVSILAYAKYTEVTGDMTYLPLMEALAEGILLMQDEQGKFVHVLENHDLSVKEPFRIIYYDGEAAFALMRLYKLSPNTRWIESVERAFEYFIENKHWQFHDHWLSYCVNELTLYRPLEKYFKFGLDNVRDHLDFIMDDITNYPNSIGLLASTIEIVSKVNSLKEISFLLKDFNVERLSISLGIRAKYLTSGFFWPEISMFFSSPEKITNSFFVRHHSYRVRIDDIESNLLACINYAKNMECRKIERVKENHTRSNERITVFLLENIREIGNGIEVASLRRAKLFNNHLNIIPSLVISHYNPTLSKTISSLRNKSLLDESTRVYSIYFELINLVKKNKISYLNKLGIQGKKVVSANEICPVGKVVYKFAEGNFVIDDFVDSCGNVLLRKFWQIKNNKNILNHIELNNNEGGRRFFDSEEKFSSWALEEQLPRNKSWDFIVDKNRAWKDFVLSKPHTRINCSITTVIHSTHLFESNRFKPSYSYFLKSPDVVDKIIVLTKEQYQDLLSIGINPEKMHVIPNHLDESLFDKRLPKKLNKRVIYLARYSPEKQHSLLIDAFERVLQEVPDAELYTYGLGQLKKSIEDLVEERGLGHAIKINGYTDKLDEVHQQACCSVLCSNHEGQSLFATESMAFGTPLVSLAIKYGPRDILEGHDAGILVSSGHRDELANALVSILSSPERQLLLQKGAIRCAERFSSNNIAKNWQGWLVSLT
ncbi:glycosyltransferase [Rosenbergiella epipactidis]|uniref:glycosyltransferase n=1 Tax=Rosenbergiella epipactidis TaxID=1544694 RepID=UPI001F4E41AD|nr:glycosyltransferase [Rosenbergiella epipactidis]